jgi:hypothetical protein
MNNEKEINEILNSLQNMQKAEAGPFLYNKVMNRINVMKEESAPVKFVWLAAASFVLLILFNFRTVKTRMDYSSERAEANEIITGYHLLNTNTINYN